MKTSDIQLDWPAYFKLFCQVHQGDPVSHRGRLLFRDGWTYASKDYAGPEWPPPKDPKHLRELQTAYWTLRREQLLDDRRELLLLQQGLQSLQSGKSVPLQRVWQRFDETAGRYVSEPANVDFEALNLRIDDLTQQITQCDHQLLEMTHVAT